MSDSETPGAKFDANKPRWSLLPWAQIGKIVDVLEYGAKKYAVNNWQKVPDARQRYFDAAMRHLIAWNAGESVDPESKLPHLAHAACSILFLMWFVEHDRDAVKFSASEIGRLQKALAGNDTHEGGNGERWADTAIVLQKMLDKKLDGK